MTAEQQIQASDDNVETVQAGTLLKNKRESLGLSQKQIADRLRLRLSIIENIENNNFSSDQVATFTRGYLRSYARAINLDEAEVLAALDQGVQAQQEEQEMKSFSRKTKREAHDSRIMTLTWGIIIVVVGISGVWYWQNQDKGIEAFTTEVQQLEQAQEQEQPQQLDFTTLDEANDAASDNETSPQVKEAETEPSIEQAPVELPVETEVIEEIQNIQPIESEPTADTAVEETVQDSPIVEEPQATQPEAMDNLLTMSFSDDCWIQVKDATGRTLSTGVKKGGQSLDLNGELPYSVILGAPENVSMTLASEPIDLSGYTSGKVARFTLP